MEALSSPVRSILHAFVTISLMTSSITSSSNAVIWHIGSFDVDPTGEASYSLPVEMPPGTKGAQPSISIIYNCHGGDDLVCKDNLL